MVGMNREFFNERCTASLSTTTVLFKNGCVRTTRSPPANVPVLYFHRLHPYRPPTLGAVVWPWAVFHILDFLC